MPRITKKMKEERLKTLCDKILLKLLMCMGYSINERGNVIDEYGDRLVFGNTEQKKFLKISDSIYKRKEIEFDPINNYLLSTQLFNSFVNQYIEENLTDYDEDDCGFVRNGDIDDIKYVRTIVLRDGDTIVDKKDKIMQKKYLELDIITGKIYSDQYFCHTLPYLEIIFGLSGILPAIISDLHEMDELKNELEQ